MSEGVLIALVTAAASFIGSWAAMRVQLRTMRHQINAAHRRLDKINAPAAGMDAIPE